MEKIRLLVIPSETVGGCGFYRSLQPHIQLNEQFSDEFSVTINPKPDFFDDAYFEQFQIIHIHKALYSGPIRDGFENAFKNWQEKGILTILDLDDHWRLSPHHPGYAMRKESDAEEVIKNNVKKFDAVTTTTSLFAKEIKAVKGNNEVYVLPNSINPEDPRFNIKKEESNGLVRVGLIMGSTHEYDVQLLNNFMNRLPADVVEKIQVVLCGFDLRGNVIVRDAYGKEHTRPMLPKENLWYRYEKGLTDNYKICSPQYTKFLDMFLQDAVYPNEKNEHYRRCWTKDINHYYEHYKTVDVLLAPLEVNDFNKVKSQLKAIESCFSHTAIIASDFGPYQLDLVNYFEKGGGINPNGNALLVDESKNHKMWAKYIEKVVKDPVLLKTLQDNLYKDLHEKYDLRNVTAERAKIYKELLEKKINSKKDK